MRTSCLALAAIVLLAARAHADVLHVPKDFATIAAALNEAQAGDEVVVAAGTYDEIVQLTGLQDIRLRGQGKVILAGNGTTLLSATGCTGVVIERLTVQGSTGDAVVLANCTSCTLRRVDVVDAGNAGIVSGDGSDVLVERCRVSGTGADGIVLAHEELSTVSRCTVTGTAGIGIALNDAFLCVVERCRVLGSGTDGILLGKTNPATSCRAERNVVDDAGSYGLASSGPNNALLDNRARDAHFAGIYVMSGSQGGLVQGNLLLRGQDGVLSDGTQPVVKDNRAVKPEIRGFFIVDEGWVLSGNRATGAGYAGYELHGDAPAGVVQDCKAVGSVDEGFEVECNGATFIGNMANGSGQRGFNVVGAGNVFVGNKAHGNADFDLDDHSGANVYFDNDFGTTQIL